jgi:uncharacterized protein YndB with AHSA1/START domain
MKNETTVKAEPGKQEMFLYREFEAPRELVYEAFSDPDRFAQFVGPEGYPLTWHYADFKTGGKYRFSQTNSKGEFVCAFNGAIHEMTFPERIIWTGEMEGLPERGHVLLETWLFDELPGGRTRMTIHEVCRSVEDRDVLVQTGMASGLEAGFKRLDQALIAKAK